MPFTPEHAATIAAGFDLKRIPSEFYTDPFQIEAGGNRRGVFGGERHSSS